MSEGRKLTSKISDSSVVMLLMSIVFGGLALVLLGHLGYIDLATVGQYMLWIVLGLAGFAIFVTPFTKSKWDDMIALFLLLMSIGGFVATYLINNGYVAEGTFILVGLGVLFVLIMMGFMKETYPHLSRKQ